MICCLTEQPKHANSGPKGLNRKASPHALLPQIPTGQAHYIRPGRPKGDHPFALINPSQQYHPPHRSKSFQEVWKAVSA